MDAYNRTGIMIKHKRELDVQDFDNTLFSQKKKKNHQPFCKVRVAAELRIYIKKVKYLVVVSRVFSQFKIFYLINERIYFFISDSHDQKQHLSQQRSYIK